MRILLSVLLSCLVCACAAPEPSADAPAYRELTTGSNIPRKGQATTVDKSSISDSIIRSGGVRAGGS